MGFFGMLFWIAVIWLLIRWWRGSERCLASGPRGYGPGWYQRGRYREYEAPPERTARPEERQEYIDSLESRVSELEERLDFTERLLANRDDPGRGVAAS